MVQDGQDGRFSKESRGKVAKLFVVLGFKDEHGGKCTPRSIRGKLKVAVNCLFP